MSFAFEYTHLGSFADLSASCLSYSKVSSPVFFSKLEIFPTCLGGSFAVVFVGVSRLPDYRMRRYPLSPLHRIISTYLGTIGGHLGGHVRIHDT